MLVYDDIPTLQIRVPTIVSLSREIQLWDQDNLYPQRCEEAIRRSYTLRSVVNSIADFLNGEGFVDQTLSKLIVNNEGLDGGETLNRLLTKVTRTYSRFESVSLHVGYDANCRISSLTYIPLEFLRYGLPEESDDNNGAVKEIKYCTNWDQSGKVNIKRIPKVLTYNIFNNDPDAVSNQIDQAGGMEEYKGQVLLLTPDYFQYPMSTFDPVLDHAQTQNELGMFKLGYTQNGFLSTLAVMYPGEFESEEEKKEFKRYVKNRTGARNANKTIALQDKSGTRKVSDMFQSLQPVNLDKIFELTEKSAISAIIENEGWPKILVGVENEKTMFNQQSLVDAYTYANAKTRNRRKAISELFSSLLSTWSKPISTDAAIQEQQYSTSITPAVVPAIPAPKVKDGNPAPIVDPATSEPAAINENLKNLSPKQLQSLLRVRRLYRKPIEDANHIDAAMAVDMLKQSLGIDEATAKLYLGVVEDEEAIVSLYLKLKV